MLSEFMVWVNNTYIDPALRISVFHVENEGNFGGKQGMISGAISKAKGKKKGVLDVPSVYLGMLCFLEFKIQDREFSDEQLFFIKCLISWKVDVFIIKKFDFFKFVFEEIIMKKTYLGGGVWNSINQIKQFQGERK